jgi:hypothetical protein
MGPQARREYVAAMRERYVRLGRVGRSALLDEVCALCGCHRKHAIRLMKPVPTQGSAVRRRPGPARLYGDELLALLKAIWLAAEQPCSKRLAAALSLWLPAWESHHERLVPRLRRRLLAISPATIDRLLRPVRVSLGPRGRSLTRPGSLLREQIPVRAEPWDTDRPGFLEADTVAHCGESLAGDFIWSITYTDIASGWTQCRATWNRGAAGVVDQTRQVEAELPFAVLGFDCDNGGEFLNQHLLRHFSQRAAPVAFTRSRPYHKNDQAYVEQKNWTHVRQLVGYVRLDRPELVERLNALYTQWGLLLNFFCPNLKLREKSREGSRIVKRYEAARTPCQRLLASRWIERSTKRRLREQLAALDPFALKKEIDQKLKMIWDTQRNIEPPSALTITSVTSGNILP